MASSQNYSTVTGSMMHLIVPWKQLSDNHGTIKLSSEFGEILAKLASDCGLRKECNGTTGVRNTRNPFLGAPAIAI